MTYELLIYVTCGLFHILLGDCQWKHMSQNYNIKNVYFISRMKTCHIIMVLNSLLKCDVEIPMAHLCMEWYPKVYRQPCSMPQWIDEVVTWENFIHRGED